MDVLSHASPGPIIVGVEHSERSRDALALARTLARAVGTRLILVAVYPSDARLGSVPLRARSTAPDDEAQAALEWVVRPLAGVRAELRTVPCTSVSRGLQAVAAEENALAIVVGPSHRGALGRIVPGAVGTRLLHGAPCPVAVAPSGYWGAGQPPIRRIGVGYEGSPESAEALAAAVGLATCTGATGRVLSVVEPITASAAVPFGVGYFEQEETTRANLAQTLRHAIDGVAGPVELSGDVIEGYADDELARLSGEVDLLVCGSRAHGPLGGVMLGSVSAGVLRKAHGPVLLMPRGARDGFAALGTRTPAAA